MTFRTLTIISTIIIFGLFALNAHVTGDLFSYLEWANVALSGDIFQINSSTLSPSGVPLTQWIHGFGFILALPMWLVSTISFGHISAYPVGEWVPLCSGLVAAFFCYWALFRIIKYIIPDTSYSFYWWFISLPIIFLGTHIGYYSFASSVELFSSTLLAILNVWALTSNPVRLRSVILVGTLGAMLITIRPYLGLFALLATAVFLYRYWKLQPTEKINKISKATLVIIILWCVALFQIAIVNQWMTGSAIKFAYIFGDQNFKSMDFRHPEVNRFLFHSWHGLLSYHPLYGVGFAAIIRLLISRESTKEQRLIFIGIVAAIFSLAAINSSWYCWWLGLASFGMRGMAVSSVFTVPIILLLLFRLRANKFEFAFWWALIQICLFWSGLLLWRGASEVFYTFNDMLIAQIELMTGPIFIYMIPAILSGLMVVYCVINYSLKLNPFSISKNMTNKAIFEPLCVLTTAFWFGLSFIILINPLVYRLVHSDKYLLAMTIISSVAFIATVLSGLIIINYNKCSIKSELFLHKGVGKLLEWVGIICFVIFCGLFVRLTMNTEKKITAGYVGTVAYEFKAPFDVEEFIACYEEYTKLNEYAEEKKRMKNFLDSALIRYRINPQLPL